MADTLSIRRARRDDLVAIVALLADDPLGRTRESPVGDNTGGDDTGGDNPGGDNPGGDNTGAGNTGAGDTGDNPGAGGAGSALDPGYLAAWEAMAADPNQCLAVAEQGGAVVGTLQLSFLPGLSYRGAWRGQVEGVRIAAGLRSQGLGARMLAWAVAQCRARGCRMVQLTTNAARTDAHRFYERIGFSRSHIGFKMEL